MIYTTEILREELSNYQNPNDKIHRMIQEGKLFPVVRGGYTQPTRKQMESALPDQYMGRRIFMP